VGRTHKLPEIARKRGSPFETAVRNPWMGATLRQILTAHRYEPDAGMASNKMVDILAGIGLYPSLRI
jgi:hypothetical protein